MATQPAKPKEPKDHKPNKPLTAPSNTIVEKLKWHIAALVVFFIAGFIFFSPMWIDGKQMNQSDIVHYKGVTKELSDYREQHNGQEALWTNSMFGGMPAFQVSTLYNGNLTHYVHQLFTFFLPHPSGYMIIAFLCMYIMLLVMGCGSFLSIGGALVYGMSTYNLTLFEAGHNTKMMAIAYMPLVAAGMILLFRRKLLWGFAVFALGLALEIRANHLQITYYLAIALGIYFVVEAIELIRRKQVNDLVKISGLLLGGAILAVASNASLLWSTSSYVGQTIRGKSELTSNTQSTGGLDKDYAFAWSYGKWETMTLMIPDAFGGSSNHELGENSAVGKALAQRVDPQQLSQYLKQMPTYWGERGLFTSGPYYIGAIVCFLFVLGLVVVKDNMRWWVIGASFIALLLAWGKNFDAFNDVMFNYLPAYNRFRTVEMSLIVLQLTFVVLGFRALQLAYWGEITRETFERGVKIAAGITAGFCVLVAVLGPSMFNFTQERDARYGFPDWLMSALVDDRKSMMSKDAWRSAGFIVAAAALLWLMSTDRLRKTYALGGVFLLAVIDLAAVDKRYFGSENFVSKTEYDSYFEPTAADQQILQDQSNYRVLNIAGDPFNDSRTSYFHKSVGGYSAVKLRRYQELYEFHISKNNRAVWDMLNTKYLIVNAGDQGQRAQQNPGALGNAWFVDSIMWVKNADEEINRIGPIYQIQPIGSTTVIVNEKQVSEAQIGYHDRVTIGGMSFDVARAQLMPGTIDTLGLIRDAKGEPQIQRKAQGAKENLFAIQQVYDFTPKRVAVIDERFKEKVGNVQLQPHGSNTVQLTSYAPNKLEYSMNAASDGFVVFSEIYYPDGWVATVDGKESEIARVDYVLRGMKVPAGKHTVVFEFRPKPFVVGEKISMASSGLLLLLLIGLIARDLIERRKKEQQNANA